MFKFKIRRFVYGPPSSTYVFFKNGLVVQNAVFKDFGNLHSCITLDYFLGSNQLSTKRLNEFDVFKDLAQNIDGKL